LGVIHIGESRVRCILSVLPKRTRIARMPHPQQTLVVQLNKQPVELFKILKFEGLVSSGAEAKRLIDDHAVLVNGRVETRRRRKIMHADVIKVGGMELTIHVDSPSQDHS